MDPQIVSIVVNGILSILSFVLCWISIRTSQKTLKQNNIMIENATRPYLSIYGQTINCNGNQHFYLVVKNSGASPATITNFSYSPDLSQSLETKILAVTFWMIFQNVQFHRDNREYANLLTKKFQKKLFLMLHITPAKKPILRRTS